MNKANLRVSLPVWLVTLSALVVLLGILSAASGVASSINSNVASASPVLYEEQAMVAIFEEANPAVVEIEVTQSSLSRFRIAVPQSGQGSGFLVDTEGHILTNYHVIEDATRIRVILAVGRTLEAQVAGTSAADDIALLRVDPQAVAGIVPLPL